MQQSNNGPLTHAERRKERQKIQEYTEQRRLEGIEFRKKQENEKMALCNYVQLGKLGSLVNDLVNTYKIEDFFPLNICFKGQGENPSAKKIRCETVDLLLKIISKNNGAKNLDVSFHNLCSTNLKNSVEKTKANWIQLVNTPLFYSKNPQILVLKKTIVSPTKEFSQTEDKELDSLVNCELCFDINASPKNPYFIGINCSGKDEYVSDRVADLNEISFIYEANLNEYRKAFIAEINARKQLEIQKAEEAKRISQTGGWLDWLAGAPLCECGRRTRVSDSNRIEYYGQRRSRNVNGEWVLYDVWKESVKCNYCGLTIVYFDQDKV